MTETYIPLSAREPLKHIVEKPAQGDQPVIFHLKRPSPSERQQLHARLFEAGLRDPEQSMIRKAQVHALVTAFPGDEGEQRAEHVSAFFILTDEWVRQAVEWRAKERERLIDEENGAEPTERAPLPTHAMSERDRALAELYLEDISSDPLVSKLIGQKARYDADLNFWLARTHILPDRAEGLPAGLVLQFDRDGVMTNTSLDDLIDFLGNEQFAGLTKAIDAQYHVSEQTEKNSASPLVTSPPSGEPSPTPNIELEKHNGSSTASPTAPTPETESSPSTGKSSSMSSEPIISTVNDIPTAEDALTNPSVF